MRLEHAEKLVLCTLGCEEASVNCLLVIESARPEHSRIRGHLPWAMTNHILRPKKPVCSLTCCQKLRCPKARDLTLLPLEVVDLGELEIGGIDLGENN